MKENEEKIIKILFLETTRDELLAFLIIAITSIICLIALNRIDLKVEEPKPRETIKAIDKGDVVCYVFNGYIFDKPLNCIKKEELNYGR